MKPKPRSEVAPQSARPPSFHEVQAQLQKWQPPPLQPRHPKVNVQQFTPWVLRPKGSAGRSNGYNIQQAMELAENRRVYNALSAAARLMAIEYLDIKKTIKLQELSKLSFVLLHAQTMFPYLQRFVNNWPFYDLIAQFLCNHTQHTRGREPDLSQLQMIANEGDYHEGDDHPEEGARHYEEPEPVADHQATLLLRDQGGSSKGRKRPSNPGEGLTGRAHKKQRARHSQNIDHNVYDDSEHREGLSDQAACQAHPSSSQQVHETVIDPELCHEEEEANRDIRKVCALYSCKDPVPSDPPGTLKTMISHAEKLISKGKRETTQFITLSLDICKEIKRIREHGNIVNQAQRWGWPVSPEWKELPARITNRASNIVKLVHDPAARDRDLVHQRCMDQLEQAGLGRDYYKLAHLRHAPMLIFRNVRPGYYGPKGGAIIEATLLRIIGINNSAASSLAPLSLSAFSQYFLIPRPRLRHSNSLRDDAQQCYRGRIPPSLPGR
ncbi:hypothetical protein JVU11DRAFT_3661 [Chiua virens]|nr:hypothetical protein JVU11DRAFT_3661 [Chiua virens]